MRESKPTPRFVVHKFGGTSVQTAERIRAVAKILDHEKKLAGNARSAVVVSAMKGTTDALIDLVSLAKASNPDYQKNLQALRKRHLDTLQELGISSIAPIIEKDFHELEEVLRGIALVRSASEKIVEFVSGHGEVWSAHILAAYLKSLGVAARYLDAREVVIVDSDDSPISSNKSRVVQWDESLNRLNSWFKVTENKPDYSPHETLVITGFVASTIDGIATTLRRNGSDFSASIFGKLLNANSIIIWTDVDGVLSADPRLVPDAVILNEMSYHEVTELANFGAKVVHPATMEPAIKNNIPVWIRNTFNPSHPGTKIHADAKSDATVKGFSAIEKMALVNMEGNGLVGVFGVAERLFGALREAGISVVMISQASSEHSISLVVSDEESSRAKTVIEKAFFAEIHEGAIDRVEVLGGRSILAAVGDNMVERPGVAGQFFSALGRAGVSINAIAQGASERNISAVIDGNQTSVALRAVHSAFYLSAQTIGVGIIGTGTIGRELLNQLGTEIPRLKERYGIDIRVRGIANSKQMILDGKDERGIDPKHWGELKEPVDIERFVAHLHSKSLPHAVLIDATASDQLPAYYPSWLKSGLHLITPNKKANTQSYQSYVELKKACLDSNRLFFYSTNVGAGLPILQTLRDLYQTGDRMVRVEGVFSGTLSCLFNSFDGTTPFSEQVKKAKQLGYTEPDPREDLSGMDVARKLVIVAREAGIKLELSDIPVENLVAPTLRNLPLPEYLTRIAEGDAEIQARFEKAKAKSEVLRYVGSIDDQGKASVELRSYPKDHPFAGLNGADNIVSFRTARYHTRPLVIQGPGAGPEVTAAGVFADLLRLARSLGAPG